MTWTVQTAGSERIDGVLPCKKTDHVWRVTGEEDRPAPNQRCRCGAQLYFAAVVSEQLPVFQRIELGPDAFEVTPALVCGVCKWTNVGLRNIGEPGGRSRWICHGCIKQLVDRLERARDTAIAHLAKRDALGAMAALTMSRDLPEWFDRSPEGP